MDSGSKTPEPNVANGSGATDGPPEPEPAGPQESSPEDGAAEQAEPVSPPTAREVAEEKARLRRERRVVKRSERRERWSGRAEALKARLSGSGTADGDGGSPRDRRPRIKKLRIAIVFSGLCLLAVVSWMFGVLMAVAQDLPDLEARAQYDRAENSIVYANDGKTPLTTLTGNQKRTLLESGEISPLVKSAVVAIEDERFYDHRGIDFMALGRALEQDIIAGGAVQGGSTITQQFVKNALEAQGERSVLQKVREAALAYQIERQWSKDKILTNYLNNIYFGEGAYGVEAAARTYFGANHPGCGEDGNRCAQVLRPEEAAMLAALISSPTGYSPRNNPEDATAQRDLVLEKMREQGTLEASDAEMAEMEAISVPAASKIEPPRNESEAPFYTDWLRQQIVDKYGPGRAFGGGLRVTSSLDLDLQNAADEAVASRLGGLGPTSAVVVLDNDNAGVLAMVGGTDFDKSSFNLATNGQRQPGSSFKPFTLVTALKEGHSPDEVFESRPVEIPFEAKVEKENGETKKVNELFKVNNYDDSYLGSASIATATTYSDNSVYAQLGTDVGVNDVVDTAHDLGIESRIPSNPAVILGGLKRGVTPLEMAYSYNTIANDGSMISGSEGSRGNGEGPVGILEVTDEDEEFVPDNVGGDGENDKTSKEVVDPAVADQAKTILNTVVTSGTGKNAQVGDDFIWGKTGTTDNNADAWFVGANDEITVAVWVGYPDGATPMLTEYGGLPVDGGTIPALLFNDIVSAYDEQNPDEGADDSGDETTPAPTTEAVPTEVAPVTEAPPVEQVAPPVEEAPVAPEPVPEEPAPTPVEPDAPPAVGGAGAADAGGATP